MAKTTANRTTRRAHRSETQVKLACAIERALLDAEEEGLRPGFERMEYVLRQLIGLTGMHVQLQASWRHRLSGKEQALDSAA